LTILPEGYRLYLDRRPARGARTTMEENAPLACRVSS
jgi:hypothetical protein